MNCSLSFRLLLLLFTFFLFTTTGAQSADIVLTNGKIFTADKNQLYVQALAIKGNKILAVGTNTAINKFVVPKTKRIDLEGKTVVPGFNDAHDHLGSRAPVGKYFWAKEFSVGGPKRQVILDSVAKLVKLAKPEQWITAEIGLDILQDPGVKSVLDSLAPNNPVFFQLMWGHGIVANNRALQLSGLPQVLDAWFIHNPTQKRLPGTYFDYGQWPIWYQYCISEPANLIKGLREFSEEQIKHGITSVQCMNAGIRSDAISIFVEARLPQRIRIVPYPAMTKEGRSLKEWERLSPNLSRLVQISGIKYLIDGTPLEQSALMKTPYPGSKHWYGTLNFPVDTIKQILKEALTTNRQLMMHIVGDSTMATVLSIMKQVASDVEWRRKRVRFEHNSTSQATPSELHDIKSLGILMMETPFYGRSSRLRSLLEKDIVVGVAPDGSANPFIDIMIMTSQMDNPQENITREQAVIAYTKTNAYAEFAEKEKGMLSKGMLADICVLSQDIFAIPVEQLPATQAVLTIVDGKIVYQNMEILNPKK